MERSLRARLDRRDDGGMSIVEVLIASVILLIALTAMLGLLMTSTGLSARARAEALAVKTASSVMERVRAVPYVELTTTKVQDIATEAAGTVGGMTVSVEASMTPFWMPSQVSGDPAAYKQIKLLVHVTGPGFKSFDFATGTFVREWQWSARSGAVPTVNFDSLTPAAGATAMPVWGAIHVGATAVSNTPDVMLTQLYVKIGVTQLASSTPNAMTGHTDPAYLWDTTTWPDGEYGLTAETWDALNKQDSKGRLFVVDNVAPSQPTTVSLTSTTGNTAATLAWAQVRDGLSLVPGYEASLEREDSSSSTGWSTISAPQRVQRPADEGSSGGVVYSTLPFSSYRANVSALGAREWANLTTPWRSSAAVRTLVTRPSFTGMTVSVRQDNGNSKPFHFTATNLTMSPPTFQGSSATYYWEYKAGSAAWNAFSSGNPSSSNTVGFSEVTGPSERAATLSFRCTVQKDSVTYESPVMTVANPSGGSTYTLANFTGDWIAW